MTPAPNEVFVKIEGEDGYWVDVDRLIAVQAYSPMFDKYFDEMTNEEIQRQLDAWCEAFYKLTHEGPQVTKDQKLPKHKFTPSPWKRKRKQPWK